MFLNELYKILVELTFENVYSISTNRLPKTKAAPRASNPSKCTKIKSVRTRERK